MTNFTLHSIDINKLSTFEKMKILANLVYDYGLSRTETLKLLTQSLTKKQLSDFAVQWPWKSVIQSPYEAYLVDVAVKKYSLTLSNYSSINPKVDTFINTLNNYHIGYSLLRRANNDIDMYKQMLNTYMSKHHKFETMGFSMTNTLFLHYYATVKHYTVNELAQYFEFDSSEFVSACEFYHIKVSVYNTKAYRQDMINYHASRLHDNNNFKRDLNIIHQGLSVNTANLTLQTLSIKYGLPYDVMKQVLDKLYGHTFTLKLIGDSSYVVGRSTLYEKYGDNAGIDAHYQRIKTKVMQSNRKRYGVDWKSSTPATRRKIGDATLRANKRKSTQKKRVVSGNKITAHMFLKVLANAIASSKQCNRPYTDNLENLYHKLSNDILLAYHVRQHYYENVADFYSDLQHGLSKPIVYPDNCLHKLNKNLHLLELPIKHFAEIHPSIIKIKRDRLHLSENERILYNLLMSIPTSQRPKFVMGDRQQLTYTDSMGELRRYELDFYFPELKIAIEINPSRYHALNKYSLGDIENLSGDSQYHYNKFMCAKKHHIKLIQLFQYDIASAKFVTSTWSRLQSLLGINHTKVYARNVDVEKVNFDSKAKSVQTRFREFKTFMADNHHSGYRGGKIKYEFRDKQSHNLIGAAVFSKSRLPQYDYELIRLAFKNNVTIVGGVSKLITHFFRDTGDATTLLTYSDNNWGDGSGYAKSGFSFVNYSHNTPIYISQNEVNGENSTYSYQINTPWGAETGVVGKDRQLKHLPKYNRRTKNFNIEEYIETELTHKDYAKQFKEENNRFISSPDDVLNTHKGYDRVFTAGSTKWIANREMFVK